LLHCNSKEVRENVNRFATFSDYRRFVYTLPGDGSVEALVIDDEVAAMIEARRNGPFAARISEVLVSDAADDGSDGFRLRATA
jgi:acylphosphatase